MRPLLLALILAGATGFAVTRRVHDAAGPAHPWAASSVAPADAGPELALRLGPGMTELCLEVRSSPVRPGLRELDLSDNRICRRPDPVDRASIRSLAPDQETRR